MVFGESPGRAGAMALVLAAVGGCAGNPAPDEALPPYRVVLLEGAVSDLRSGTPLDSVTITLFWSDSLAAPLPLGETVVAADGTYRLRVWVHPHLACDRLRLLAQRPRYLTAQTQSGYLRCAAVCQRVDVRLSGVGPDSVPGRVGRGRCRQPPGQHGDDA